MKNGGKREGAGRKKLYDNCKKAVTRISSEMYDVIPHPKAEFFRDAIIEKLKRENLWTKEN